MPMISLVERVKLNYALCTIASIVIYTFSLSAFSAHFSKLWPHVIYFILSEMLKLLMIQRWYAMDVSYNQEGLRRRRSNRVGESVKFALLMMLTVISFAFICVIMGGKWNFRRLWPMNFILNFLQHRRLRNTKKHSLCQHFSPHSPSSLCPSSSAFPERCRCYLLNHSSSQTSSVNRTWSYSSATRF